MEPYTNLHHNAKSFFDIVKKSAVGNLVFMKLKLCFLTSYQFAPLQLCFLRYKPKPARPCFQVVNIAVQKCDLWKSEFYKLSALGLFLFVEVKMFFDLPTYLTQDEGERSYSVCRRQKMLLSVRPDSSQFII